MSFFIFLASSNISSAVRWDFDSLRIDIIISLW